MRRIERPLEPSDRLLSFIKAAADQMSTFGTNTENWAARVQSYQQQQIMFFGNEAAGLPYNKLWFHSSLVEEVFLLQPDVAITIAAACGSIEGVKYYLESGAAISPLSWKRVSTTEPYQGLTFLKGPLVAVSVNGHAVILQHLLKATQEQYSEWPDVLSSLIEYAINSAQASAGGSAVRLEDDT